jgi:drug/metabolite transporter (DMT)-like permease
MLRYEILISFALFFSYIQVMSVYFIMLLQSLIASGTHIVAKVVVRDVEPVTLTMVRSAIAAIGFCILAFARGEKFRFRKEHLGSIFLLSFLAIPVNQFLFLMAMRYTTPTNAALFYSTTPALVLVLSSVMGRERVGWKKGLGVLVAFSGVCLVIFEHGIDFKSEYMFGNILLVVAVFAWAYYTVQGKFLIIHYGAIKTSIATMVLGTIMFLPIGLFGIAEYDFSVMTVRHWSGLLYLAIGTSVFSYLLWYSALSRTTASKVAIFSNLQPILTTILAWTLLGQTITPIFMIGGVIALGGIVITQYG